MLLIENQQYEFSVALAGSWHDQRDGAGGGGRLGLLAELERQGELDDVWLGGVPLSPAQLQTLAQPAVVGKAIGDKAFLA
jgi:hypothetical protein